MWCDIDELLGVDSGMCTTFGSNGTFSFALDDGDSLAVGHPGDNLAIHGTLQNLSSTDNVHVLIKKAKVQTPKSWQTALCADICYASDVEETEIVIPPASSQPFIFYFYTDMLADSGFARVQFVNTVNQENKMSQRYFATTQIASGLDPVSVPGPVIYPNPMRDVIHVSWSECTDESRWVITDMGGRSCLEGDLSGGPKEIDTSRLVPGLYVWTSTTNTGEVLHKQLLMKQ